MRPLWERTLTWGVADHLRRSGVGESASYSAAALIVRDLDRRNNLMAAMAVYPLTDPGDIDDPEKTSPRFLEVTDRFWRAVGSPSSQVERNRLMLAAVSSLLSSGPAERDAAAALAREAPTIEASKGKIGMSWEGLGGLREELASRTSAEVMETYDTLVRSTSLRKTYVKEYQTWAKARGWYTGVVDGIWGPKTEDAMGRTLNLTTGRYSNWEDAQLLQSMVGFPLARSLGVFITRDVWLGQHPERLTPVVAEVEPAAAAAAEAGTGLPTGSPSQIVVSYPKEEAAAAAAAAIASGQPAPAPAASGPLVMEQTASIQEVKPSGWRPTKNALIGGGLVVGGVLIVAGAWWASRRKQTGQEESL